MRQRKHARTLLTFQMAPPGEHSLLQRGPSRLTEMKALGIRADCEHEFDLWQCRKQFAMPEWGAFAPRRKIGAILILSRKAEAHRYDGDAGLVVKFLRRDSHPIAQAVAGGVGEGGAG